ncbi:PadR family transcriptional regulator [Thalassiella azotivora]
MPSTDPQMLKGVLTMLLLHLVGAEEDYGYRLVVRLRGYGVEDVAEGTVYPALTRLESQGLLESRLVRSASGPARKYYRLTRAGERERDRAAAAWRGLVRAVDAVTASAPGDARVGSAATGPRGAEAEGDEERVTT